MTETRNFRCSQCMPIKIALISFHPLSVSHIPDIMEMNANILTMNNRTDQRFFQKGFIYNKYSKSSK
jgi:hypothetical protein